MEWVALFRSRTAPARACQISCPASRYLTDMKIFWRNRLGWVPSDEEADYGTSGIATGPSACCLQEAEAAGQRYVRQHIFSACST